MFKFLSQIRLRAYILYSVLLNKTVRNQIKNPFSIPIIIVNYNQLESIRNLINTLTKRGFYNIVIIDNKSTYPELLEYYDEIKDNVNITLHRLNENLGHMVLWLKKDILNLYSNGYFVLTDPDIMIENDVPNDFMTIFIKLLNKHIEVRKVGFSLKIDDIPEFYPNREKVINWEKQFWETKVENGHFLAKIDTTFALYRPTFIYDSNGFESAVRTKKPYITKHLGWYINYSDLTEEQKFYFETANSSSSWLSDEKGNLLSNRANKHYD